MATLLRCRDCGRFCKATQTFHNCPVTHYHISKEYIAGESIEIPVKYFKIVKQS